MTAAELRAEADRLRTRVAQITQGDYSAGSLEHIDYLLYAASALCQAADMYDGLEELDREVN
jgi:hypothetical protein